MLITTIAILTTLSTFKQTFFLFCFLGYVDSFLRSNINQISCNQVLLDTSFTTLLPIDSVRNVSLDIYCS